MYYPIILLGISVGLSNFAASIAIGLSGVNNSIRFKTAIIFGLFETLMPIIGLLIGKQSAGKIGFHANYIGGGLLILTGLYIIFKTFYKTTSKNVNNASDKSLWKLIVAGLALSIDNLIVGFSLGTHKVPLVSSALIIGSLSVVLALIGLEIGNQLSSKIEAFSELLSGFILVLVGSLIWLKII